MVVTRDKPEKERNNPGVTHQFNFSEPIDERENKMSVEDKLKELENQNIELRKIIEEQREIQCSLMKEFEGQREQQSLMDNIGKKPNIMEEIIDRLSSIDVPLPQFTINEVNPKDFINKLEKYFKLRRVPIDRKVLVAEMALTGQAKTWFEIYNDQFEDNYEKFKIMFFERFYSVSARMQAKRNWESRRYESRSGSLQEFFQKQWKEARMLQVHPDEECIYYEILQQLPHYARNVLAAVEPDNVDKILRVLSNLDNHNSGNNFERVNEKRKIDNNNLVRTCQLSVNRDEGQGDQWASQQVAHGRDQQSRAQYYQNTVSRKNYEHNMRNWRSGPVSKQQGQWGVNDRPSCSKSLSRESEDRLNQGVGEHEGQRQEQNMRSRNDNQEYLNY